jgi:leucyl-tRNA synthetase
MMPHLAESCWQALGHKEMVVDTPWPKADPALTQEDVVTYAVQVNGKLRAARQFSRNDQQAYIEKTAQELEEVKRALGEKVIKKIIFVRDRIVNIVV